MEIKETWEILQPFTYGKNKKWVAVDDILEILEKDGIKDDSMKYQQGWYISRWIRKKLGLNTASQSDKKKHYNIGLRSRMQSKGS